MSSWSFSPNSGLKVTTRSALRVELHNSGIKYELCPSYEVLLLVTLNKKNHFIPSAHILVEWSEYLVTNRGEECYSVLIKVSLKRIHDKLVRNTES